jgi:hypothetical protein
MIEKQSSKSHRKQKDRITVRYTPETWAAIRAQYQSGKYKSVPDLLEACKKVMKQVPSYIMVQKRMIRDRKNNDPWNKHLVEEIIVQQTEKTYRELFDKYDMGREKRVQLIVEGILARSDLADKIIFALETAGLKLDDTHRRLLAGMTPDLLARKRFMQEANKLVGDYSPEKIKLNKGSPGETDDDPKTEEEIVRAIKRIHSNNFGDGGSEADPEA